MFVSGRQAVAGALAASLWLAAGSCAPGHHAPPGPAAVAPEAQGLATGQEWVGIAPDGRGFVLLPSGRPFVPWGANYDHDRDGRLLEDYWQAEWPVVEEDFAEIRALGANTVRIHLQLARFMRDPVTPEPAALEQLGRLVALAGRLGLYLDITGLGCYRKADVPAWYDALGERERWECQARFWEAVAERCAASPAVFCYDLMNEPVVAGAPRPAGDWLGPPFAGLCFVQFITLDPAGRPRPAIARAWTRRLVQAIRARDRRHLVTVGLVDWSLNRPGLTSGFVPAEVASELDFLSVHIYPESGGLAAALETLAGFGVGRPVLIEELFPLRCGPAELREFIEASVAHAAGWISFYWGMTREECRRSDRLADHVVAAWLDEFAAGPPAPARPAAPGE